MSKKTTKRALAMSFVSVFLCVCMLVGTTFAWFTDSVTSTGNIIKSGTLDVEMSYADGKTDPAATTTVWKDASEGAIFTYDKWEPGYVDVKHIQISNEGSLALKYQLNIIANGEVTDLAKVIDVYFVDGGKQVADRTALAAATPVGTLDKVLDGTLANLDMDGDLKEGETDIVTIALKMRESATNEYQGLSIGSDFSVVLMATQKDYESDSFDNTYDDIGVPTKDIKVIDGNEYYYDTKGNFVLSSVPYGNVGATFTVPNGVTILGEGDVYDGAVPVFSKSSLIESITLPEGLVEIKARAITGVKTLTSIKFPSTLKAIRAQALSQTGMDELTVPANVEVIGEGAFRDMANLTTVTIEGNPTLANFVFRSCPNLTSIYLLGDDVKFEGGGQFATHSDNGDATGITIYVKNTTVAARVYAAQTSAYGYEVKVLGAAADGSDAVSVTQVKNATDLGNALAAGKDVVLKDNVSTEATTTAPYGNKYAFKLDGGVLDGNGNELYMECYGDDYGIMTSGGTVKNITIKEGCRAIMIMYPTEDVILDNVNIGGDGVLYAINTGEAGAEGVDLIVTNSTLAGWTSYSNIASASFTNVKFEQGTYYNNIYGRVLKPYVNTTLTNCSFIEHMNLDLSSLAEGQKVTFVNCTVNGQAVTADVFTIPTEDAQYDTDLFTIDLPSWATSIADCIVFN